MTACFIVNRVCVTCTSFILTQSCVNSKAMRRQKHIIIQLISKVCRLTTYCLNYRIKNTTIVLDRLFKCRPVDFESSAEIPLFMISIKNVVRGIIPKFVSYIEIVQKKVPLEPTCDSFKAPQSINFWTNLKPVSLRHAQAFSLSGPAFAVFPYQI